MNYTTTFPCGDFICQLIFDGKNQFLAFWWENIPSQMTGPMQASFNAACEQLCKEAFVPYDPNSFSIISLKSPGPLNAVAA